MIVVDITVLTLREEFQTSGAVCWGSTCKSIFGSFPK